MSIQIRDTITPGLRQRITALKDPTPALEAGGLALVSLAKRAFTDASLRPMPWKPRKGTRTETNKDGRQMTRNVKTGQQAHALLRKSGNLFQSITITQVTRTSVTVGSNAPYAAVQQLGSRRATGRGGGIPARPFFPFFPDGRPTPLAAERVRSALSAKIASLLR